jgi:hypothetical protein
LLGAVSTEYFFTGTNVAWFTLTWIKVSMFVFRKEIKAMGVSPAKKMSSTFTMFKAMQLVIFIHAIYIGYVS